MPEGFAQLVAALAGRYTIERELGAGGMATVYLAHDVKHNRKVAVKVLRPELAAVVGAVRFLREIEVTANLQHPHILPLFESGEADGQLFYVMPFVEGPSLRTLLEREGPLAPGRAVRLLREVADALAYAHARGVVHRDIKPDNVMLSGRHAIVTDFGVARAVSDAANASAITTLGMAIGTPAYMAPEQASGDPATDHRADIYAFGVFAYELLAGQPPFTDRPPQQILAAHISEDPAPLSRHRPVAPELEAVVMRCLAKDPAARFATAEEIVQRLEGLATPGGGTLAAPARPLRRARLTLGLLAGALIAAVVGIVTLRDRSDPVVTSSSALAVFPFRVQGGPDLQYLGEGMVNLLATSMDGAGELRSVDPRAVIARVTQGGLASVSPDDGARIAADLGAGVFILGDLVQVGTRLRIDAALYDLQGGTEYDLQGGTEPIGTATVDGDPDDLLDLVDQVASQLLASGVAGADSRVTRIAAVTTSSLAALKSYLEGETAFRAGRFTPATEAFRAATVADSQFALAFYRLSVAAEWALRPELAEEAAEQAVALADRLADHDRRLLEALRAARRGESEEAARRFRSIVSVWPQDLEAWFQLAEVQFHYGPLYGHGMDASRDAFERVVAIEPRHAASLLHLVRLAAHRGDTVALDSLTARFLELNPGGERSSEAEILRAVTPPDSATLALAAARLRSLPDVLAPQATWSATIWSPAFEHVISLIEITAEPTRSAEVRALAHVHIGYLETVRGRWAAAMARLDTATTLNEATALEHRAFLMLQPFAPVSRGDIAALRDTLTTWDAAAVGPNPIPTAFFAIHDRLHEAIRLYLLGMCHVLLGDPGTATQFAGRLEGMSGSESTTRALRGLANGLRAAVAQAEGDPERAAELLETTDRLGNYEAGLFSPFHSRAADRYRRAVLLDSLGRSDEAARLYRSFEDFNLFDRVFAAPAALRVGRWAERDGRPADARRAYARAAFLWADADSALQPLVASARAGLARISDR